MALVYFWFGVVVVEREGSELSACHHVNEGRAVLWRGPHSNGGRAGCGSWSSVEIFQQVDNQLCFSEISFTTVFKAHEMVE